LNLLLLKRLKEIGTGRPFSSELPQASNGEGFELAWFYPDEGGEKPGEGG
jgi:hypothetical protein